jgi:thiol-disulfide isomerase/thioredoxin
LKTTRSTRRWTIATVAVLATLAGACGDDTESSDGSSATSTTTVAEGAAPSEPAAGGDSSAGDEPSTDFADWQLIEVTDTGGETFTIADLAGRPVFVENFATWCSNCRDQLRATQDAAAAAGDDAVFLALSVETELDVDDMADYQRDNGFDDIRFAVMSPELLAAMDAAFGTSALNPPSTPKVAVAADGTPGELVTGSESSEQILNSLGLR